MLKLLTSGWGDLVGNQISTPCVGAMIHKVLVVFVKSHS